MNMNSIKTLAYSLLIIFLFSYVSEGILLAFELKKTRRNNWIKIVLIGLLFVSTLALLWAPYQVFGQTAADGLFTLERIECQAACTHAPVVTLDWEYFDDATVDGVRKAISDLREGKEVRSTRGPVIKGLLAAERQLAGFDDDEFDAPAMDEKMLAGLNRAKEVGQTLPSSEV